jgi:hypothetical protein
MFYRIVSKVRTSKKKFGIKNVSVQSACNMSFNKWQARIHNYESCPSKRCLLMTKHYITGDVYYYTYSFTVAVGYNANTTYEEYRSRHSEYECDKCEHQANRSYQRMFVRGYKQFITFLCDECFARLFQK